MKKLGLVFLLLLSACTPKVEPVTRKTVDELEVLLKDADAESFTQDVSTAYSLFPIAFADSNGDRKGDLQGIISKLDYLNDNDPSTTTDLGIDAVWMNPIYPSDTYHKYDINDYKAIDKDFGTMDDFKMLLSEAHKRGIKIILDMVFNHSSDTNPWFMQGIAGKSPYDEYYMIKTKIKMSDYPGNAGWYGKNSRMYFAGFWSEMPDLNAESELLRTELKGVLDFWMDLGVDGFRFDAVTQVYALNEYPSGTPILALSKQFWMEMKQYIEAKNKDVYTVGEAWVGANLASSYAPGFDSLFNFDLALGIVTVVKNSSSANLLDNYLNGQNVFESKTDHYVDAIFLTNHDQNRIMSEVSGDITKAKLAANILFTLPGIPFVYYGEELGMFGVKPDEHIREAFPWNKTTTPPMALWVYNQYNQATPTYEQQVTDPESMFQVYRSLIELRKNSEVLRFGDIQKVASPYQFLAYSRSYNGKTWIVVHNVSASSQVFTLSSTGTIMYTHKDVSVDGNQATLGSRSTLILEVN
jgi:alpha-amylase